MLVTAVSHHVSGRDVFYTHNNNNICATGLFAGQSQISARISNMASPPSVIKLIEARKVVKCHSSSASSSMQNTVIVNIVIVVFKLKTSACSCNLIQQQ